MATSRQDNTRSKFTSDNTQDAQFPPFSTIDYHYVRPPLQQPVWPWRSIKHVSTFDGLDKRKAYEFIDYLGSLIFCFGKFERALHLAFPITFRGRALLWFNVNYHRFSDWPTFRKLFWEEFCESDDVIRYKYWSYQQQHTERFRDFVDRVYDEGLKVLDPNSFQSDMVEVIYCNSTNWAKRIINRWVPKPKDIEELYSRYRDRDLDFEILEQQIASESQTVMMVPLSQEILNTTPCKDMPFIQLSANQSPSHLISQSGRLQCHYVPMPLILKYRRQIMNNWYDDWYDGEYDVLSIYNEVPKCDGRDRDQAFYFLLHLEAYINYMGGDFQLALTKVLPLVLTGVARVFYDCHCHLFQNWATFREKFLSYRCEPDYSIERKYCSYFQRPKERFCDFVDRVYYEGLKLSNPMDCEYHMMRVVYTNATDWAKDIFDRWAPRPKTMMELRNRVREHALTLYKIEQRVGCL